MIPFIIIFLLLAGVLATIFTAPPSEFGLFSFELQHYSYEFACLLLAALDLQSTFN